MNQNNQLTMNHKLSTILVTGGAGYIGSLTVKELLDQGYDVVAVDSLENGHKKAVDSRAKLEILNTADTNALSTIFDKCNPKAVIDFAAYLSVGESMEEPRKYLENNVGNFIKLLDVMVKKGCRYIVKSSTAAAYGNPQNNSSIPLSENYTEKFQPVKSCLLQGKWQGVDLEAEPFLKEILKHYSFMIKGRDFLELKENDLTRLRIPSNVYGVTKVLDEIILEKYINVSAIKYVSLRYFNAAGASEDGEAGEDHPTETHLIPLVIKNILNKSEFSLTGTDYNTKDGTAIRDFVHVCDLAKGHIKALEFLIQNSKSDVFNLGTGIGYTVGDVILKIEKILGKEAQYSKCQRRPGDPEKLIANPDKAKRVLDWSAKYSLDEIIKTACNWHKKHPNGY